MIVKGDRVLLAEQYYSEYELLNLIINHGNLLKQMEELSSENNRLKRNLDIYKSKYKNTNETLSALVTDENQEKYDKVFSAVSSKNKKIKELERTIESKNEKIAFLKESIKKLDPNRTEWLKNKKLEKQIEKKDEQIKEQEKRILAYENLSGIPLSKVLKIDRLSTVKMEQSKEGKEGKENIELKAIISNQEIEIEELKRQLSEMQYTSAKYVRTSEEKKSRQQVALERKVEEMGRQLYAYQELLKVTPYEAKKEVSKIMRKQQNGIESSDEAKQIEELRSRLKISENLRIMLENELEAINNSKDAEKEEIMKLKEQLKSSDITEVLKLRKQLEMSEKARIRINDELEKYKDSKIIESAVSGEIIKLREQLETSENVRIAMAKKLNEYRAQLEEMDN